jgi:hypothetical protein
MIKGTELEGDDVVTILRKAHNTNQGLFNNAAQSFNHEFYWQSMKPGGGGKPTGKLAELIDRDFGSYDNFRKEFTTAALTGMIDMLQSTLLLLPLLLLLQQQQLIIIILLFDSIWFRLGMAIGDPFRAEGHQDHRGWYPAHR